MKLEIILVLVLSLIAVVLLVAAELHSRRNQRKQEAGEDSNVPGSTNLKK